MIRNKNFPSKSCGSVHMRLGWCVLLLLITSVVGVQPTFHASTPSTILVTPSSYTKKCTIHQESFRACFLTPFKVSPRYKSVNKINAPLKQACPNGASMAKPHLLLPASLTPKHAAQNVHYNQIHSKKTRLSSTIVEDWTPLYLSSIAGASTCIGAAIVFLLPAEGDCREVSPDVMAFSLSLAGSVMITVTAISIGPECMHSIDASGNVELIPIFSILFLQRMASFALGCALYFGISSAFPEPDEVLVSNMNEASFAFMGGGGSLLLGQDKITRFEQWTNGSDLGTRDQQKAWRVALLLFISLLFHNFPEGLAVAASALESDKLGLAVTIGIMIHNIPEGIAIAVPCLAARPNQPWLSFLMASFSGLAEPLGALVTLIFLKGRTRIGGVGGIEGSDAGAFLVDMENVLAFVAGIMVAVALCELLPEAEKQKLNSSQPSLYWVGIVSGCIVMLLTELMIPSL